MRCYMGTSGNVPIYDDNAALGFSDEMSPAEVTLRIAQGRWANVMKDWVKAQENIRIAKSYWDATQREFFQASTCPEGCSGCPSRT